MGLKRSLVFGLVVAMAFPVTSLYFAWNGGKDEALEDPERALENAIEYAISNHDELKKLNAPSSWRRENITPKGRFVGATILRFTCDDWTAKVAFAPIRPSNYDIEIEYIGEGGFHWEGRVEQDGYVVETAFVLTR